MKGFTNKMSKEKDSKSSLYKLNTPTFGYYFAFGCALFAILIGILLLMILAITYFTKHTVLWQGFLGVLFIVLAIISVILLRRKYSWETILEISDKDMKLHNPKAKNKINTVPISKCEFRFLKEFQPRVYSDFVCKQIYVGPILEIKGDNILIYIGTRDKELHWLNPHRNTYPNLMDMTYRLPTDKWMKLLKDFKFDKKITKIPGKKLLEL